MYQKLIASKTKFMLFSKARDNGNRNICISTMQGLNIERVTNYKYLGIWTDDKLTFKYHIEKTGQ